MNINIKLTKSQKKQLSIVEKYVKDKKPVCMYGEAGIGKTVMAYILAKRLNREVVEVNASDERTKEDIGEIMRNIRMYSIKPLIYLFDEVDYFGRNKKDPTWRWLLTIIALSAHPVVMTCNEKWKIPSFLQKNPKTGKTIIYFVRVYQPNLTDVSNIMKKKGFTRGLSVINKDFRASKNALLSGAQTERELTIFDEVKRLITSSEKYAPLLLNKYRSSFSQFYFWLLNNAIDFYTGKDLYDVLQMLSMVDITNKPELLSFLPKGRGNNVKYPSYFEKKKIYGR